MNRKEFVLLFQSIMAGFRDEFEFEVGVEDIACHDTHIVYVFLDSQTIKKIEAANYHSAKVYVLQKSVKCTVTDELLWQIWFILFLLTHRQGFFFLRHLCRFYLFGLCLLIPTIRNKFKNIMDSNRAITLSMDLLSCLYIKINLIFHWVFATSQLQK